MSASKPVASVILSSAIGLFAVLALCFGPLYFSAALVCLTILALRGDTRRARRALASLPAEPPLAAQLRTLQR